MGTNIVHGSATRSLLLVEDDSVLALTLCRYLEKQGFTVHVDASGSEVLDYVAKERPAAVILDANLPGRDGLGFDLCRELRSRYAGVLVMLTARDDKVDQIVAFELGADAYITKPAEPRLVLAQLNACLRRVQSPQASAEGSRIQFGTFDIDAATRTVTLDGEEVSLTTAEFDLLWLLASHAGKIVSRDDVQMALRGIEHDGLDRSIDMRISRLRKRLGDDTTAPRRIKTVRAKGYLLSPTAWD